MPKRGLLFAAAVAVQLAILGVIAFSRAVATFTGADVHVRIAPYDPYDPRSGYHAVISFPDISQFPAQTPQGQTLQVGQELYVVIERGEDELWKAVAYSIDFPETLAPNQAVMIGEYDSGGRVIFGIETFYLPEERRDEFAKDLAGHADQATALIKIDPAGDCAITEIDIGANTYR